MHILFSYRRYYAFLACLMLSLVSTYAQQQEAAVTISSAVNFDSLGAGKPVSLYGPQVPGSKPAPMSYKEKNERGLVSKVTHPEIIPFLPDENKRNGTAVIICPGGGYSRLSMLNEGARVARAFADAGVTAFVLKYRLPSDSIMSHRWIGPLQDAQQAIRLVRLQAQQYRIDTNKVGIIGFSAGGHLASTAATHFDTAAVENKEGINLRPDFAMLIYPVISFGKFAHRGSRAALVGPDSSSALAHKFSNELRVSARTPPTFLLHATDDGVVHVQNSVLFYQALLANNINKSALFVFQEGGHGFGLANKKTNTAWFDLALEWLKLNGF